MENVIVIKHPVHFPIPDEEVRRAVEAHGGLNVLDIVTIELARFSIGNADMLDFPGLALSQAAAFRRELTRDLNRGIGVAYFGLAPIPLCIHLGSLLGGEAKGDCLQSRTSLQILDRRKTGARGGRNRIAG